MKKLILLLTLILCRLNVNAQKIEYVHLSGVDFYEGCANKLLIKGGKKLSIGCNNASYILREENTKGTIIWVVPNFSVDSVSVMVVESGFLKSTKKFNVKEVPPAQIVCLINNKEIDTKKGVFAENLSKIILKVIPDTDFAKIFPDEVKYEIRNIKYILKRSNDVILTSENITEISTKAKKGDVLEIQINDIRRINFRGSVLLAKVSNPVITIPIL